MLRIKNLSHFKYGISALLLLTWVSLNAQVSGDSKTPQYLFPDFMESVIKMRNGNTRSMYLNYNFITEGMVYKENGQLYDLLKSDLFDTIFINNRMFVPYESSYYEVLVKGNISLYIQNTGELKEVGKEAGYGTTSQTTSITNISGIYSNRAFLNLELPDNVKVQAYDNYWLRKDSDMKSFKNKKQYLEIFPDIEDNLDEFIKDNRIRFRDRDDLIKLVKYTNESLSQ